jgi:hypothetical protein
MIDFSDFKISSKEELNRYVSDEDIYSFYIGPINNNKWFKSPFRPNEKSPSFRISYYNDKWVWIDYGLDPRPKDAINFVMDYFSLSYYDSLDKIYKDIYLNKDHKKLIIETETIHSFSYCNIRAEFEDFELEYWNQVNINKEDLLYWNIFSGEIRHNGVVWHSSKRNDPLFIYMWDKSLPRYKGYRPYSKDQKLKFYAHNIANHIQGIEYIPSKGDMLIITKSYKDIIIWNKLGYPSIAPHSENMFLTPFDVYDLQSRFKKIYVNYDNDETGVLKSSKFTKEYGLNHFNLPKSCNCKDPFEFIIKNSYDDLNNLFKEKIQKDEAR